MRRFLLLLLSGALAAAAVTARPQPAPPPPGFGTAPHVEPDGAVGRSSAWYCPWVDSGATRDSVLSLAALVDVDARVTLPSPIPNAGPDTGSVHVDGPGARDLDVSTIVRRGEAPGVVEFDDGPATAAAIVWSDAVVTGDRCVAAVPKEWQLPGGTTADGFFTSIRLFNPFPEAAKATVRAFSEFGSEPLPELEGLDVPGRSWTTIDLGTPLPLRDHLGFVVSTDQGLVIPELVVDDAADEASWPGVAPATTWEFPIARVAGLDATLELLNTGSEDVAVDVDLFTPQGAIPAVTSFVVPAGMPVQIVLGDFTDGPFGVRVRASGPLSAVVEARSPGDALAAPPSDAAASEAEAPTTTVPPGPVGLAGTVGAPRPATRWLVPGTGVFSGADTTLWILNTGAEDVTATLTPLGVGGPAEKVVVAAGSILAVSVDPEEEAAGYAIEATGPVSAAVSLVDARGVAFVAGVAAG